MTSDTQSRHPSCVLPCPADEVDEFLSRPSGGVLAALRDTTGPVLVLGANGKMGLHLSLMLHRALALLENDSRVIAVSRFRTAGERRGFEQHGIAAQPCDLMAPAQLAALPDAPTVFYLAGVKFGTSGDPGLLQKANVEMPRLVARRFGQSRIVAFSSGCVYPFVRPETGGATEDTPVAPVGGYAASCVAREEAFMEASVRHGTPVALIRLNYSVEFRYGLLVDIALKVMSGEPIDVTMGHVNVIWQRDAVDHVIQCVALAASPAVPVNITGQEVLSVRSLAERFGELLQCSPRIVGQEAGTAWLNNAARSHDLFGPPPTPVEDMMRWVAAWLKGGGSTLGKPTGFERRDGQF